MAAKGRISTYLCLITCSIVLFKNSKCSASVFFQNGGKRSGRRCFECVKTFFFFNCRSWRKRKTSTSHRKTQIMFRNKCTNCGATWSKSKFVKLGEGINLLCRKCYNKMRRSPGVPNSKDKSGKDLTTAQTSREGGKLGLIYN